MINIILLLLLACPLVSCCPTCRPAPETIAPDPVKTLVAENMTAYGVPGVQVCIKNRDTGKTIRLSLGQADLKTMAPLSDSTQMKVGSITKSFTALGILLLADRGQLDLDDAVGKYLQIENAAYRNITIRQLMNMDSGLRGYLNDDAGTRVIDAALADPARQFTPQWLTAYGFSLTDTQGMTGKRVFHYSNTNYILLGMIIERVSGMGYAAFVQRELVEPLGLRSTFVPVDNQYGPTISGGYHFDKEDRTMEDVSALDLSYVWSAGAVISTASDLCDWIIAVASGRVVSPKMQHNLYAGLPTESGQYTAGLIAKPDRLWHNGTVLGYHGEVCYLRKSHIAIAVLSNCTLAGVKGDPVREIMEGIIAMVAADRLPMGLSEARQTPAAQ